MSRILAAIAFVVLGMAAGTALAAGKFVVG